MKTEIEIRFTIEIDDWKLETTKNKIFDLLKELDVVSLEMEEK